MNIMYRIRYNIRRTLVFIVKIHISTFCLKIYLSTFLSNYLSIYLSTLLPIFLSIYLIIYIYIYLSTFLSIYLYIYLFIYLSIFYLFIVLRASMASIFIYEKEYFVSKRGFKQFWCKKKKNLFMFYQSQIGNLKGEGGGVILLLVLWIDGHNCYKVFPTPPQDR